MHYICTGGCKGVTEHPDVCQAVNCSLHGQPLEECNCEDGLHFGKTEQYDKDKEDYRP